ncbi:MAG: CoA transferase [Smithellaceae bacterium]|nr:CoA transferase [Smithellaceae bacterium]
MKETKPGPLAKYTILDFTWVLAGPHATKMFTDLGANVIKVEQYQAGANERWLPMRVDHDGVTQSSYSINVNRGKKSICVNLKSNEGMELIRELIQKSDVLIENFSPEVMGRLNLDYESVKKIKKDIVYCSISCFGHWGPYSHKPGYDIIAQSASGWIAQSKPNIMAPVSIGDMNASMYACTAILSALLFREQTGTGQNIDISMMDCLFGLHENTLPWYMISEAIGVPKEPMQVGAKHPGYSPYGIYQGKNGSIAIALLTEARWPALVKAMGEDFCWLKDDPRFKTVSLRCTTDNAPLLHETLEKWVMTLPTVEEAEKILEEAGIPCMRVRTLVELATKDPQIKAREMISRVYQPFIGPMMMYGCPLKMSETSGCIRGYAPLLGEHNREVLQKMLGRSDESIDKLYQEGVLYHEEAINRLPAELAKMEQLQSQ